MFRQPGFRSDSNSTSSPHAMDDLIAPIDGIARALYRARASGYRWSVRRGCRGLAPALSALVVMGMTGVLHPPETRAQGAAPAGEPEVQLQGNDVAPSPPPQIEERQPPIGLIAPPIGPEVTLRAASPKARLQILGQQLQWRDVCAPPCRTAVPANGTYRVGGATIRPSESFNLPRRSGPVLIEAELGSSVKRGVGIGLIIGGIANAAFGALYYSQADSLANSSWSSSTMQMGKDFYQAVGIATIITGVILVAVGIPLAASSTSVEVR